MSVEKLAALEAHVKKLESKRAGYKDCLLPFEPVDARLSILVRTYLRACVLHANVAAILFYIIFSVLDVRRTP